MIKEKYGLEFAYNYGAGGTRIARQIVPARDWPRRDLFFELRADTMERSADAVVVFGGTNDYGHGDAPFGELSDICDTTFCGAVNSLILKLKKDFPHAKIVFMTPLHRLGEMNPSRADQKILKDYADAIVTICEKHSIPVIDLFKMNPIDPTDKTLIPDGLHPNDHGHEILADIVAAALEAL